MSWQRIFKAARRMNAPVVLADQGGTDPLVILPLAQYERLLDQSESNISLDMPSSRRASPDGRVESVFEDIPLDDLLPAAFKSDFLAKDKQKKSENQAGDESLGQDDVPSQGTEISLDERFYFEPLEDEVKK
jgi:hypothetical protein